MPSFETIRATKNAIRELIDNLEFMPELGYPVLYELELNKNLIFPFAFWSQIKENSLSNEQFDLLNNSNFAYLTNTEVQLFNSFSGQSSLLTPLIANGLIDAIRNSQNYELRNFLGRVSIPREVRAQAVQPLRYQKRFMVPRRERNRAIAAIENGQANNMGQEQVIQNQSLPDNVSWDPTKPANRRRGCCKPTS